MRPLCSALALLLTVMLLGAAPAAEGRRPVVPQRPGGSLPVVGSDAASCDNGECCGLLNQAACC